MKVKVKPNSGKSLILGEEDGILHVALKAAPEDGKANTELLKLLKKEYGKEGKIISGKTSKLKIVVFKE